MFLCLVLALLQGDGCQLLVLLACTSARAVVALVSYLSGTLRSEGLGRLQVDFYIRK